MDLKIQEALERDTTIDITTRGRKTGQERRIEIWFTRAKERIFITGTPGKRDWYANLQADPNFTFHLKESLQADLPARARPILDLDTRRRILSGPEFSWYHRNSASREDFIQRAPLVEVDFLK